MTAWSVRGLDARQGAFELGPVDLDLGEAETVAVIGRSGSGKTTLLRALAGLLPLAAGSVRRGDADCTGWPPERRRIAYVPQGLGLFPHLTVRHNVRFAARLHAPTDPDGTTEGLLRRFRLEPLAGRRPSQLSTGEQQRVAVARALATDPALLLWDEPLGALDVATREELLRSLATVREEDHVPLVLVTHDPSIAYSLADRFLLLDVGRVRFLGPAAPLVHRPGDPFVARFLGYENVYSREELQARSGTPMADWLLHRSGPAGVAFIAGAVRLSPPTGTAMTATVRRKEPTPSGLRVDVDADGLGVSTVIPLGESSDEGRPGAMASRVGLELDPTLLRPLEGWT